MRRCRGKTNICSFSHCLLYVPFRCPHSLSILRRLWMMGGVDRCKWWKFPLEPELATGQGWWKSSFPIPNPHVTGHSWQMGNLTRVLLPKKKYFHPPPPPPPPPPPQPQPPPPPPPPGKVVLGDCDDTLVLVSVVEHSWRLQKANICQTWRRVCW